MPIHKTTFFSNFYTLIQTYPYNQQRQILLPDVVNRDFALRVGQSSLSAAFNSDVPNNPTSRTDPISPAQLINPAWLINPCRVHCSNQILFTVAIRGATKKEYIKSVIKELIHIQKDSIQPWSRKASRFNIQIKDLTR